MYQFIFNMNILLNFDALTFVQFIIKKEISVNFLSQLKYFQTKKVLNKRQRIKGSKSPLD